MSYSQNDEEEFILNYFGDYIGYLVDIGANDGITFSNTYQLIQNGWYADLFEPHKQAFDSLYNLHNGNQNVTFFPYAIGLENGKKTLHKGSDSLLSTFIEEGKAKWHGTTWEEEEVDVLKWEEIIPYMYRDYIDFLSVDAEGMDYEIIKQIDLMTVDLICFEKNNDKHKIIDMCEKAGKKRVYESHENYMYA